MHGYIRRKVTRSLRKGPGVPSSNGRDSPRSDEFSVIDGKTIDKEEIAFFVNGDTWIETTHSEAEYRKLKWSGVIEWNGIPCHLYIRESRKVD